MVLDIAPTLAPFAVAFIENAPLYPVVLIERCLIDFIGFPFPPI